MQATRTPRSLVPTAVLLVASFGAGTARAEEACPEATAAKLDPALSLEVQLRDATGFINAKRPEQAGPLLLALARSSGPSELRASAMTLLLEVLIGVGSPACEARIAPLLAELEPAICANTPANTPSCKELTGTARQVRLSLARREAEQSVKAADEATSKVSARQSYLAAGERYLTLWEVEHKPACLKGDAEPCSRADEVLYNAARAFQAGHDLTRARATWATLTDPTFHLHETELGMRAVYERGASFQATADYEEAATHYERFAKLQPKSEKAPSALLDATVLRLGLHQGRAAEANADAYARMFGAKRPVDTAKVGYALAATLAEQGEPAKAERRLRGVRAQLAKHTPELGPVADVLLAELLKRQGKPEKKIRELYERAAATDVQPLVPVYESDPKAFGKMLIAIGKARLALADELRDAALKLTVKKGDKDSLGAKREAVDKAEKAYQAVLAVQPAPPPVQVVEAGARVARLKGQLWAQAFLALGDEPSTQLLAEAKQANRMCVELGVKYEAQTPGSRACAAWLARHYPDEVRAAPALLHPPTLRGEPPTRTTPLGRDGEPQVVPLRPAD